ncbi:hypothetical protein RDI58_020962 [Solanum bulbocastanum]|uniref:Uncharacterized protein n=1 Tax=Solanum bulbocastanum TaxID=147425 RepID=A0AAN8T9S3_SOLBU
MDKNIIVAIFVVILCVTTATAIRQGVITAKNRNDDGIQEAFRMIINRYSRGGGIQEAFKR